MDAKDRRIAELEAENAAKDRRIAELEKRPVLEADVLASFSAFDENGDGYLTTDGVGAVPTARAIAHVNPWRSREFSVACASNVREMRSTAFSVGIDTVVPEP